MAQALDMKPMNFEEFLDWMPDDGDSYELHQGTVIAMQPTGSHNLVGIFVAETLNHQIRKEKRPYRIPQNHLLKPQLADSGYRPDVVLLDNTQLANEPLWQPSATVQHGRTIPLVVEVVNANWQNDYGHKLVEYEAMGISEYWIVDFQALGAMHYLGHPRQPTITICQLENGVYQLQRLVAGQTIDSKIFDHLTLTTDAVFQSAQLP
jgi:Uma2 family endonuclease